MWGVCVAACNAMARFVADDMLRAALLGAARERAALDAAVTRLAGLTWDRAAEPGLGGLWVLTSAAKPLR